jgi:type I restriction enzyme M protein
MQIDSGNIVQKLWGLCHILRGDGVSYHEYISELTYLLFLKIADETQTEELIPEGYRWRDLVGHADDDILTFYRDVLTYLGGHAQSALVRRIYAFPTTVFSHSENLRAVIDGMSKIDWHDVDADGMGDIYEGLLARNSQDARSGAGQYFTPRALVNCIVRLIDPRCGEVIQDPSTGSGGFLISADQYIREHSSVDEYKLASPTYEGVEIEKGTHRICLMNAFLHRLDANIVLGDALTSDAGALSLADVILANPPFGAKAGSARPIRNDIEYKTANKQLLFIQHIYKGLKSGGRAAVVLPDNVLFEDGVGKSIRADLMERCNLHTILRLPTGIFYSQGVKTNVLFFKKGTSSSGNTSRVWVYDMRTAAPKFGKTRQLREPDFAGFCTAYAEENRTPEYEAKDTRWRSFTRKELADRNDNLDLSWLGGIPNTAEDSNPDPEAISLAIVENLQVAIDEFRAIVEEFNEIEVN